jgi:DNA topoisomerase-3
MRILHVAEKNDAAKTIAASLSKGHANMVFEKNKKLNFLQNITLFILFFYQRQGCSKFNKIYEFDYNLFNANCKMIFTSVSGHLLSSDFTGPFRGWNSCNPVELFSAPLAKFVPENYDDIRKTLEREVRSCQKLVIWTDCDREGENIGFEIIEVCKDVKPSLDVYRARFSEMTAGAIQRAIRSLERPNENVSNAVDARIELDLRIG